MASRYDIELANINDDDMGRSRSQGRPRGSSISGSTNGSNFNNDDNNNEGNEDEGLINTHRHSSVPKLTIEETQMAMMSIERRKEKDKNQLIWVFQIQKETCKGELKEITLRELLQDITSETNGIDTAFIEKKEAEARRHQQQHQQQQHQQQQQQQSLINMATPSPPPSADDPTSSQGARSVFDLLSEPSASPSIHVSLDDLASQHSSTQAQTHTQSLLPPPVPQTQHSQLVQEPQPMRQQQRRKSVTPVSVDVDAASIISPSNIHHTSSNVQTPHHSSATAGVAMGLHHSSSNSNLHGTGHVGVASGAGAVGGGGGGAGKKAVFNPLLTADTDSHATRRPSGSLVPGGGAGAGGGAGTATPAPGGGYTVDGSGGIGGSNGSSAAIPLRIRDLRRLDFTVNPNIELSVQNRRHCVLLTADPIRAIVTAAKVTLFVPPGGDTVMEILEKHMLDWLTDKSLVRNNSFSVLNPHTSSSSSSTHGIGSSSAHGLAQQIQHHQQQQQQQQQQQLRPSLLHTSPPKASFYGEGGVHVPFEIHTYDSVIQTLSYLLQEEKRRLRGSVMSAIATFKQSALLKVEAQENMRAVKDQVGKFLTRISNFRRNLDEVIEDDEGMALMALSKLRANPGLYRYPLCAEILSQHEEIEETLEAGLHIFSEIETEFIDLRTQLQSTEEHFSLRLDISRNEALIANTVLSILGCSIGFGGYITGAFGMNLDQVLYLEPRKNSFVIVCMLSFAAILLLFSIIYVYFARLGVFPSRFSTA